MRWPGGNDQEEATLIVPAPAEPHGTQEMRRT